MNGHSHLFLALVDGVLGVLVYAAGLYLLYWYTEKILPLLVSKWSEGFEFKVRIE